MTTAARDQAESPFATILGDLVRRVPGAFAAALVDWDGECVDYAVARRVEIDPFDIKVAAAHWAIVVDEISRRPALGAVSTIVCRGEKRSFILRALPDRYALIILLKKRAGFVSVTRALDACERALAHEADWTLPKGRGIWFPVDVEIDERDRPTWLTMGSLSSAVEVLGALTRLHRRERGFRVRLPSGGELNLVREAGNRWYADEKLG
ncbi:MAG TPA: roadblock/LC7 domain-containing protein [Polyangiaceae bacterium]|jgi:predicted regulator of Ras-like GTPase activity (Roadblock/LC7/MglB family)